MIIENILAAFVELGNIKTIILMMVGVAGGLIAGAIPGFTIAMAVVLTLPFTFGMPAPQGLAKNSPESGAGSFTGGTRSGVSGCFSPTWRRCRCSAC